MHRFEKTDYGFRITARGTYTAEDVEVYQVELLETLSQADQPFSLVVDVRGHVPFDAAAARAMERLHEAARQMSLQRTAIVVDSPVLKSQALQIADNSKTAPIDRIIDASRNPDWEKQAIGWAAEGIEPGTVFEESVAKQG